MLLFYSLACTSNEDSGIHLSNAGPDGKSSFFLADCSPIDEGIYQLIINTDSDECDTPGVEGWNVQFTINTAFLINETPLSISGTTPHNAVFNTDEQHNATEGEVTITFGESFEANALYTGYYWLKTSNTPLIEGSFQGSFCEDQIFCG